VDCDLLTLREWDKLLDGERSLLYNARNTVCFKNIQGLSPAAQKKLQGHVTCTAPLKTNRLIFTCASGLPGEGLALLEFLRYELCCLTLDLPSLVERKEDIPDLVNLYLQDFALSAATCAVAVNPDAMALLKNHHWEHNVGQLRQVVRQLAAASQTPFIGAEDVAKALSLDGGPLPSREGCNFDPTLDEIVKDIIRSVLKEENFNQSKAARRLGISRTTLWRKLGGARAGPS
jgi:transcriptional regulator with AAA-type ATPase domain